MACRSPEYQEYQTDQQEYPENDFGTSLEKPGLIDQHLGDTESGLVGGRAELVLMFAIENIKRISKTL